MSGIKAIDKKTSLFLLTWHIFVELLLQMLVGNVDQFMIGKYSETAVAAIGNVNQIMNLITITFNIISMATTILVSQYLGSKNYKKVSEIYTVAIFSNLIFSALIGMIMYAFSEPLFRMMNMPSELYTDARIYINIVGGFLFVQAVFMTFGAIFRSNGLMKQTMAISVVINIVNIVGNTIFLNGYLGFSPLGVKGVALSSVISRIVGLILIIIIFTRKLDAKISLRYLRPFPKDTFKSLLQIGIPSGGESISYNIGQMVILTCVNTLGTAIVTTRIYASMIAWFSFLYASAISSATQIIVGHLVGANDEDGAYELIMKTLRPTLMVSLVVSVVIFLFSKQIFGIFTTNPEIIALGKTIMFIEIFLEFGRTVNLVIIRGLQAAGDIKFPVFLGIGSMWGVSAAFAFILGIWFGWGLVGVWIAMAADECLRAIIVYMRRKKGSWRGKALVVR